jgi:hypothetical protein
LNLGLTDAAFLHADAHRLIRIARIGQIGIDPSAIAQRGPAETRHPGVWANHTHGMKNRSQHVQLAGMVVDDGNTKGENCRSRPVHVGAGRKTPPPSEQRDHQARAVLTPPT